MMTDMSLAVTAGYNRKKQHIFGSGAAAMSVQYVPLSWSLKVEDGKAKRPAESGIC